MSRVRIRRISCAERDTFDPRNGCCCGAHQRPTSADSPGGRRLRPGSFSQGGSAAAPPHERPDLPRWPSLPTRPSPPYPGSAPARTAPRAPPLRRSAFATAALLVDRRPAVHRDDTRPAVVAAALQPPGDVLGVLGLRLQLDASLRPARSAWWLFAALAARGDGAPRGNGGTHQPPLRRLRSDPGRTARHQSVASSASSPEHQRIRPRPRLHGRRHLLHR